MLSRLQVKNYVLIDSLEIDFPEGLIIITGQTGAGKSILLGALSLLMGAKADAAMVSEGADNCVVEAEFETSDLSLKEVLEENEVEYKFLKARGEWLSPTEWVFTGIGMLVIMGGISIGCFRKGKW